MITEMKTVNTKEFAKHQIFNKEEISINKKKNIFEEESNKLQVEIKAEDLE